MLKSFLQIPNCVTKFLANQNSFYRAAGEFLLKCFPRYANLQILLSFYCVHSILSGFSVLQYLR